MAWPETSPTIHTFFERLASQSGSPEDTLHFLSACEEIDVTAEAKDIRAPTLIVHVRGDQMVPLALGRS
jgi:hypothetical protein